jgi:CheY-like chemotaxis protein
MADARLEGRNVLVVEDDFIVAMDICIRLEDTGARILGPVALVNNAMTIIDTGQRIDAAVLDVNLKGENSFPVADALADRKVPFVFTTGYDQSANAGKLPQGSALRETDQHVPYAGHDWKRPEGLTAATSRARTSPPYC